MGLKEKFSSIKGIPLITSFVAAETLDSVMTSVDLNLYKGTEISPFGGAELMSSHSQNEVFILKTGITAIMIGVYALASTDAWKEFKISIAKSEIKPKYVIEKTLQGANAFAWGTVLFNSVMITPDILKGLNT